MNLSLCEFIHLQLKPEGAMPGQETINLSEILDHPRVKKVTDDISPEVNERRAYRPPMCEVFSKPTTLLREINDYRFELDKEAEKQLPYSARRTSRKTRKPGNNCRILSATRFNGLKARIRPRVIPQSITVKSAISGSFSRGGRHQEGTM